MKVAIVANLRWRKSIGRAAYCYCHNLTAILGITFQHITLRKIKLLHTQMTDKIN